MISEERTEIFRTRYLPRLKSTPEKFVEWLIESGLKVVVATSARRKNRLGQAVLWRP